MSGTQETLIVCPDEEAQLVDTFAIGVGVVTLIGTVIGFFVQRARDKKDEAGAKLKEDEDRDREFALERVRKQLSILVGPLQRLWKTQTTLNMAYRRESGHGFDDFPKAIIERGQAYWMTNLEDDFLKPFIDDPHSYEAKLYRNFVTRRLKPIWTRVRELVLAHMSDLADMPTQEEWLQRYTQEDITSPYTGSVNINVIYDSYTAYTFEFDDIVESWAEGDFQRMQPTTKVPFLVCNVLIDLLYENAKGKEAKYNKHVTFHKNTMQANLEDQIRSRNADSMMDKAKHKIEEQMGKAKDTIEETMGKAKDTIEETMGKAKETIEDQIGKAKETIEVHMGQTKEISAEHVTKETGEA